MPRDCPFLTAQWRNLVMLNYAVQPNVLEPYVPAGTELDIWQDRTLISLVGFQFLTTRLKGWPIPWHQNFSEVNLRFYVRRDTADGWRRGVVFLKEIVSKLAVSWVANTIYHENYLTLPMSQRVQVPGSATDRTGLADYRWKFDGQDFQLAANFNGLPKPFEAGTEAEFITEHYWGYTQRRDGSTAEYRVDHPTWRIWSVDQATFRGDAVALYGPRFGQILADRPCSSLVAEGSAVTVYQGRSVPVVLPCQELSADSNDRELAAN